MKTERQRFRPPIIVGGILLAGAFAAAGPAAADPATPTTPAPGQPVVEPVGGPSGPVAAPPIGAPTVPEIENPQYGAGNTPGQFGYIRDLWHTFHSGNPLAELTMVPEDGGAGAPAGAGPAPKLPPGFISLTDPASSNPIVDTGPKAGGPALPPGYYPLNGPPPPGYYDAPGSAPVTPAPGGPGAPPPPAGFAATPSH